MLPNILWISEAAVPPTTVCCRCIARGLVIVTENARDFRALVGPEDIHPGLSILPCVGRERSFALLQSAIDCLGAMGNVMDAMVNHVLEVDADGAIRYYPLPV